MAWTAGRPTEGRTRVRRRARIALTVCIASVCAVACSDGDPDATGDASRAPASPPSVQVTVGDAEPLQVEIAATQEERRRGLMHRKRLDPRTGMLFLFPSAREGAFWMYQTFIPLSIAWAADGRVIGIDEMEPCPDSDPTNCPRYPAPAAFDLAVEAPAGTFTAADVKAGDQVRIDGDLPTPTD